MSEQWRRLACFLLACALPLALHGCGGGGTTTGVPETTTGVPATTAPGPATTATLTPAITTVATTTSSSVASLWACESGRRLPDGVASPEKKGLAVDDVTFAQCHDELTGLWPHAAQPVTSLRLFAAWKPEWNETLREETWQKLKEFVERTNAVILMGTEVCGEPELDDQMWGWTLNLTKFLGKERILAVAIGNEIDINIQDHDVPEFWETGFFDMMKARAADLDAAGFGDTPLTTVWSQGCIGEPFDQLIMPFLTNVQKEWGNRWVWSFNPYSIWDQSQQPQSAEECQMKVAGAVGLDYMRAVTGAFRDSVTSFVGSNDYTLIVAEAGWSSPTITPDQADIGEMCPLWSDKESLWTFYKNMMEWDLSLPGTDPHGVDHFFYFTMRDACQHGTCEGFGLISQCGDTACKIGAEESTEAVEV